MPKTRDTFYSLPEVWDFCLEKIYDKTSYVAGLEAIFARSGVTKRSLILDAGCGSGFPTIELLERGWRIVATDKSSEMVRQIKCNAVKRGLSLEAYQVMWQDLAKRFDAAFDFLYCRGNSLIYAASWEQNWIVPERSREEIRRAVENFFTVLKPGGTAYIDAWNRRERPHIEILGTMRTRRGQMKVTWEVGHDEKARVRTWIVTLDDGHRKFVYPSYSYFIPHAELLRLLRSVGFRKVEAYVPVVGERNYDVFLARK